MFDVRRGDLGWFAWGNITVTHLNDANGVIAFTRDGGKYLIVLNFKGSDLRTKAGPRDAMGRAERLPTRESRGKVAGG
jgi:hypothetical protein